MGNYAGCIFNVSQAQGKVKDCRMVKGAKKCLALPRASALRWLDIGILFYLLCGVETYRKNEARNLGVECGA